MSGRGGTPTSQLTIPAHPDAGATARRALTAWLGGHPRLEDALLAVTELVNNAVIHGGLRDGENLTVAMEDEWDGVRLMVRHVGLPFEFAPAPHPSHDPQASRGLMIVGQIVDRWGIDSDGTQVTAWFEVSPRLADLNGG